MQIHWAAQVGSSCDSDRFPFVLPKNANWMWHEASGKRGRVSAIRSVLSNGSGKVTEVWKKFFPRAAVSLYPSIWRYLDVACPLSPDSRCLWRRHHHLLLFSFRAYQVARICIDLKLCEGYGRQRRRQQTETKQNIQKCIFTSERYSKLLGIYTIYRYIYLFVGVFSCFLFCFHFMHISHMNVAHRAKPNKVR